MTVFKNFESFNQYIRLPKPLDGDIDIGYYDAPNMLLKSEPVMVDFYRISIKINFIDNSTPDAKPITAVFFNT
jgi:hypothetical protein